MDKDYTLAQFTQDSARKHDFRLASGVCRKTLFASYGDGTRFALGSARTLQPSPNCPYTCGMETGPYIGRPPDLCADSSHLWRADAWETSVH